MVAFASVLLPHWSLIWLIAVAVAVLLLVLERHFIQDALPWLRGAEGERRVGALLSVLEQDGFEIIHSLRRGRGDIDHVIVGPAGIFVVDTKAWRARPRISDGRLLVGGVERSEILRSLRGQAAFVRELLSRSGADVWVEPILASALRVPHGGCRRAQGVWVMAADDVVGYVRSRPTRLSGRQVSAAAEVLTRS